MTHCYSNDQFLSVFSSISQLLGMVVSNTTGSTVLPSCSIHIQEFSFVTVTMLIQLVVQELVEYTSSIQMTASHSKFTVTWTQMVVGGPCSNEGRMDRWNSIVAGWTMKKDLGT